MQRNYQKIVLKTGVMLAIGFSIFFIIREVRGVEAANKSEVIPANPQDLALANNWQLLDKNNYAVITSKDTASSGDEKKVQVQVAHADGTKFDTAIADGSSIDVIDGSADRETYVGKGSGVMVNSLSENSEQTTENADSNKIHQKIKKTGTARIIVRLKMSDKQFYKSTDSAEERGRKYQNFQKIKGDLDKQVKGGFKFKRDLPIINSVVMEVNEESFAQIEQSDLVESTELDGVSNITLDTSVAQIKANQVWSLFDNNNIPLTGVGERIAVIDTGVDYTHPDLGGCLGGSCKVIGGYDFVNDDYDPIDDNGHGTHVAATAAGNGLLKGVAPSAQIIAYKVCNSSGSCFNSDVIAALNASVDPNGDGNPVDHVDVATLSLGGTGNPDDSDSLAVDSATAAGVVVTVAAGNSGPTPSTILSPGTARTAITVAAACKPSQIGTDSHCATPIASFSSRGPLIWNGVDMQKPDVAAPGVLICAARWASAFAGSPTCFDNNHIRISGTSMATPHVAGAAALLRQAYPQYTPAEIKQVLKSTADSLGTTYNDEGAGLVDLVSAIPVVSHIASNPSIWSVQSNATVKVFTTSTNFVVTPVTDLGVLDISFSVNTPGITASFDKTQIDLSNNTSGNFTATVAIDNDLVPAGSYNAAIAFKQNGTTMGIIPVIISVQPTISINPSQNIDYGVDNPSVNSWTSADQNITISNRRTDTAQTVNLGSAVLPSGVTFVAPASIDVPAGGSMTVATHFVVDNTQVANKIYNGTVTFANQTNNLAIPTKFTKFYVLTIQDSSTNDLRNATVWIHNRVNFSALSIANSSPYTVYLDSVGPYDAVIRYQPSFTNNQQTMATVYKEGIAMVDGSATVNVSRADAIYSVKNNGVDSTGNPVPAQHVRFFHEQYLPANFGYTFITGDSLRDLSLNNYSGFSSDYYHDDIFQINAQPTNILHIFYDKFQGLNANQTFTNTPDDFQMLKIQDNINRSSGTAQPIIITCTAPPAGVSCMDVVNSVTTLPIPITQTVYSLMPAGSYIYQESDHLRTGCPASGACSSMFYTPYLDVRTKNRYFFSPNSIQPIVGDTMYNGLGPVFWNVKLFKASSQSVWVQPYISSLNSAFLRQDFSLGQYNSFNYSLNQGGNTILSGSFPAYAQSSIDSGFSFSNIALPAPGAYELAVNNFPYQINGQAMTASVKEKFDTTLADANPPALKRLYHYTNNIRTEIHDASQVNKLEFEFDPMGGSLGAVSAEVSNNGQDFVSVPVTNTNGVYSVVIPAASGLQLYTRLTAHDSSDNQLIYTFEMPVINSVVDTTAPTTTTTFPTNSTTVSGLVNIQANASDNVGVTKVEFYANNQLIGTDTDAPYSMAWNTAALTSGNYALQTKAYDLSGNIGVSPVVTVSVFRDITPPTISLTAPASGATLVGTVTVSAAANDNVGVSKVDFYRDNAVLIASDVSSPYSVNLDTSGLTVGAHSLYAIASDAANNQTTSTPVNVTVQDQTPPSVSLTAPVNGAVLSGTVTVSAAANDNIGVGRVDFYRDNNILIGSDVTAPYSVNLNTVALTIGAHSLYAIASDAANNQTTSTPVSVTVQDQQVPVTTITNPLNNSNVSRGTNVTIQANATDNIGISKVEFYVGGVLKCTDVSSPYSCVWAVPNQKNAQYQLQTKAYDGAANMGASPIISVKAQ